MRDTFVRTLTDLAEKDKNVMLVTGDLGFGVLKNYWETYPEQFINAGIAEQNMTGLAAGMALEGKIVFTYSIGNFPTLRCLEQIRNDAAYHNANVKIVAVGGGFAYGALGMSHHATEDIAIMRALPDVIVLSPGDIIETEAAVKSLYEWEGTGYLRLGRGGGRAVHNGPIDFEIGKAIPILEGSRVAIFSTGEILEEANKAAIELNQLGISTGLYSFPTVKPIDAELIQRVAKEVDLIVTVEEHNILGGFGGAVAEVLAGTFGNRAHFERIGLEDRYSEIVGSQEYLRDSYGMSAYKIVNKISNLVVSGYVIHET
ncbi:transketolase family protein [Ferdinandcohnia quinoae]|uniref:1-deoxy-D-xylulose-5-phosphate synthase n=1 Tax=Fredinandcohnia quinoae TaxID=2918902 RepID=A0AAW5E4S4_9BACI|nr:transketolase C-terminal domain-containing protein [Fredinandcohnia sp. SECRCQ15]MCH1624892.1 1-deoxy-D-xylulose-5-phosphate synthase [Fredinandcohnia sp. SECRCQ15]